MADRQVKRGVATGGAESQPDDPLPAGSLALTDPRALRALAHPLRLSLLGLLRIKGPLTASQAAVELGATAQSCTYHLGQLAKWGLVEEAGGGRGRERPWRATALSTTWDSNAAGTELAAAARALESEIAHRYLERMLVWIDRRQNEPSEWREAGDFGDSLVYLTAAELRRFSSRVRRELDRYAVRLSDPSSRPVGCRPVTVLQVAFPIDSQGPDESP